MHSTQLLEEIEAGQAETLTRAAKRMPRTRRNRPVTLGCLVRWITNGVWGPNGHRIKLEAARLAGKWVTTPKAIGRFVAAQTPTLDSQTGAAPRTPRQRNRADQKASDRLDELGL
jgi:hypothetical protein